jgi:hypothetical protein
MTDDNYTDFLEHPPQPVRHAIMTGSDKGGYFEKIYVSKCKAKHTIFYGSILDDCDLRNCTLTSCILTSGHWGTTENCKFRNCLIRGTEKNPVVVNWGEFVNCKIQGGKDEERSMKDRYPKDPAAAQMETYEGMSNVLLTEQAVDYLRQWAWRTKRKLRVQKLHTMKKQALIDMPRFSMDRREDSVTHMGPGPSYRTDSAAYQHDIILECNDFKNATLFTAEVPVDYSNDDILEVWSTKKAGKRLFHVNDSYFVKQQLEMPLRRMEMYGPQNPWQRAETYGGESSEKNAYCE